MTRQDRPANSPPPSSPSQPATPAIALPRPNPSPLPWSESAASEASPFGLRWGLILTLAALVVVGLGMGWALRRRRLARRREAESLNPLGEGLDDQSPAHRLRAAALAVRTALVAAFGPSWNARTTEEVARDPALAARFGLDLAEGVVAFLMRVDRVRFGGEECESMDDLINSAHPLAERLRASEPGGVEPAITSPSRVGRSGGRRRPQSLPRRSGA